MALQFTVKVIQGRSTDVQVADNDNVIAAHDP